MEIKKYDARDRYRLGRINRLSVLRIVSIGAYLEWNNEDGILLPLRYCPSNIEVGQEIDAFVYHDNEGRLIATTLTPKAVVGEVALLDCVSVSKAGAFLDWGIHKDLLVPFAEQKGQMQEGRKYLVYVYIDHVSQKIVASAKLNKHIGNTLPDYAPGAKVTGVVAEQNDVGYRVVVDQRHWGMLYYDEQSDELYRGQQITAYVVRIREDGKIDLANRPVGYAKSEGEQTKILRLLRQSGGSLPIGDKSSAEEIKQITGLSKKAFKIACGGLYKKRKIDLSPTSIRLTAE